LGLFAQGGIAEELVFRGYLFGHLREGRSFWRAAGLATIPFFAVHLVLLATMSFPVALAATALSLAISFPLAHLYEISGRSIWPPAILHFIVQGAIKLVVVPDSEMMPMAVAWMVLAGTAPYLLFFIRRRAVA
jgi:membrane protease YdiL (CAAX protease family)